MVKLLPASWAAPAMCPGFPNMPPGSVPVHILPCVELKGQWLSDYRLRSARQGHGPAGSRSVT